MIELSDITVVRGGETVLERFSACFEAGRVTGIVGRNGIGKSTILSVLAGLEEPISGQVKRSVRDDEISFMFQDYRETLLPWRTLGQNIVWPLEVQGVPRTLRRALTEDLLHQLDIPPSRVPLNRYPFQASGGQAQTAALVRALISRPRLLLLDEPLAALDYSLSLTLTAKLKEHLRRHSVTTVLVSHSIEETLLLCDTVLILSYPRGCPLEIDLSTYSIHGINSFSDQAVADARARIYDKILSNEQETPISPARAVLSPRRA